MNRAMRRRVLWISLLGVLPIITLATGCGTSTSQSSSTSSGPMAGNWQFQMQTPGDSSFVGAVPSSCTPEYENQPPPLCFSGFVLQDGQSLTGQLIYAIALPVQNAPPSLCSSGSGALSGKINNQDVTLTLGAGAMTFTFTGTLSADGSTITGTYNSTDGKGCGTEQSAIPWTANIVQPLTGSVQGSFHSTGIGLLNGQDFPVTGTLTQGTNIGASNATVTGKLAFQDYPCLGAVNVNGQISGNTVRLQLFTGNGLDVGEIGTPSVAMFGSTPQGGVLHGTNAYGLTTSQCPGGNGPGDKGNLCLALGGSTVCTEPVVLSPAALTFPPRTLGETPFAEQVTLTNTDPSGATLNGLTLSFDPLGGAPNPFGGFSDFDLLANYTERDTCAASLGTPFSLGPGKTCVITVSFSPQQSCPWLPSTTINGQPPSFCPFPLNAKLSVDTQKTNKDDQYGTFSIPITGTGLSALVPSVPEVDFGSEAVTERSPAQVVSFANQGLHPVEILPTLSQPCTNPAQGFIKLPRPLAPGSVSDFQVIAGASFIIVDQNDNTIEYLCDSDPQTKEPNFQISSDTCSGRTLYPKGSCSLDVTFVPQPATPFNPALDYFLELNTLQCTDSVTTDCEIDSGRFPVELKANLPSPLRMTPGAGLDFGVVSKGQTAGPLTITLYNDPKDPNAQTITFTGNIVKGDYTESDDCGTSLAPGNSCTLTFNFSPKIVGFDPGTLTITYTIGQTQTVYLRGTGQ